MTAISSYRIAAVILAFVFVGHTFGGMLAQASVGPAGDAVRASMKAVEFDFFGSRCTWQGFHLGFGFNLSLFLGLSAFSAWHLDGLPAAVWPHVAPLAWALVVANALAVPLSWMYFFTMPSVSLTVATALLLLGTLQKSAGVKPKAPAKAA